MTTTLLRGGRIHSTSYPGATAMAVRDGVIAWLGGDGDGLRQFPGADILDLDGGLVTPAFVDNHVHLTATGLRITGLDLGPARSLEHCLRLVSDHAAPHPGRPVWGHGWDDTEWPAPPTTDDVDAIAAGAPVYLARVDVHSAVASTALRRRISGLPAAAGYHPQLPLTAQAHHLVRAEARRLLTVAQRDQARVAALDAASAAGIVAVHECAGPDIGGAEDWQELRDTAHGVEVIGYWGEAVSTAAQARALIEATGARGLAGDLFVDGALGSRTAWLCEPYADAPHSTGTNHLGADAIAQHLLACTEAGVTAGFHVIGDAAVTAVVDALRQTAERFGVAAVARCGHRLEHLEMVSAAQAAELGAWGITASMQPVFDALWGGADGMYARRLGRRRAAGLNPFALLASAGVPLAFGSDTPVTSMSPWEWVRAAHRHHTPASAITVAAAVSAATLAGLRPGAPASYAVWDSGDVDPATALPRLLPGEPLPHCRHSVHRGIVLHG